MCLTTASPITFVDFIIYKLLFIFRSVQVVHLRAHLWIISECIDSDSNSQTKTIEFLFCFLYTHFCCCMLERLTSLWHVRHTFWQLRRKSKEWFAWNISKNQLTFVHRNGNCDDRLWIKYWNWLVQINTHALCVCVCADTDLPRNNYWAF